MTLVQKKTGGGAWQVTHERGAEQSLPHEILVGQQIPVADGSTAALPWGQQDGSDLLDLTDPVWPKFRAGGVYAISLTVEQQDSPSGSFKCLMGFTTPSQDSREVAAYSPQIFAASQFPIRAVAITLTATAEEGGGIILNVTSTIGGGTECLYRIYLAVVQKLG